MRRLYWKQDKLRNYQNRKLQYVVNYAYNNIKFYNEKFKENNVYPDDIKTIEDLNKLPVIKKHELKNESPDRLVSPLYNVNELKVIRTSGSTGVPFKLFIDKKEDDWRKSIYMRANISCGQRLRDRWVVVTAPHHFSDTTSIQRRLGIFSQDCVSVFDTIENQKRNIEKLQPDVLDGYSGSLLLLAKNVEQDTVIRPKVMFGSAELIDSNSQKVIERAFNAPFLDQFGCAEIDRSAWQCPEKIGYHMDVDSVITQFVDDDGIEVGPEESGNIVYTSLFNYAMPLLRYSVGDVGKSSAETCPCGRTLPLMKVIEGRKDSVVVLPSNRVLSPRMFTLTMSQYPRYSDIEQFRVIQKKIDLLHLYIERKTASVEESIMERELREHFRSFLSLSDEVLLEVIFVDRIPLGDTGKLQAVFSEIA